MATAGYLTREELEAGIDQIRNSPTDHGVLELIVRRPQTESREVVESGELDLHEGLIGDNWKTRGSRHTPDASANPEQQLNLMNSRAIALIAGTRDRWQLAGDQLYVDLDLSEANLPPGTQLAIGSAVIEVTPIPHLGCKKFVQRFGLDAMKLVNSDLGKELHLRGVNAKVIHSGRVQVGDRISKIAAT